MLAQLDSVEWADLTHAYGDASDVPNLIRSLLSPSKQTRESSLEELFGNIWHQGTVYEASVHALPFLIDLLRMPETPDPESVARLVACIIDGHGFCEVHYSKPMINPFTKKPASVPDDLPARLARERAVTDAIHEIGIQAVDLLIPHLSHGGPETRRRVGAALARYPERSDALKPELQRAIQREPDNYIREELAASLEKLKDGEQD